MADQNTVKVPLTEIGYPEPYIRAEVDGQRVNLFTERTKETGWFLPPIKIMRLEKAEVVGKGDKARTIKYRILDGVHRYLTAGACKIEQIECIVYDPMPQAAAFMFQFRANSDGPLPFNREVRDNFIRTARKLGSPLADIATATGLTETSISRIASGKQSQSKEAVSASRKAGAAKRKARKAGKKAKAEWSLDEFTKALKTVRDQATKHRAGLHAWVLKSDAAWTKHVLPVIDALQAIRKSQ